MQFSRLLVFAYATANRAGILDWELGSRFFQQSYFLYKRYFEDASGNLFKHAPQLLQGGDLIDVGANIGYHTLLFAPYLGPNCKLHAFEPDSKNFRLLTAAVTRAGHSQQVVLQQSAVGAHSGFAWLHNNSGHHGDHRIAYSGRTKESYPDSGEHLGSLVPLISIDQYVQQQAIEKLALIKIDVQGYEQQVCAGMVQTLEKFARLALIIEVSKYESDPSGADSIHEFFCSRGFKAYLLDYHWPLKALAAQVDWSALLRDSRGAAYCNLLYLRGAGLF